MHEKNIEELTRRHRELTDSHNETLERMGFYEARHRASRRWLITAIVTALGGAGGTGGIAYFGTDDANVRTALAVHVAEESAWRNMAISDLERLQRQNDRLIQAVASMKATIEELHRSHRLLSGVKIDNHSGGVQAKKKVKISPHEVEKKRSELGLEN